MRSCILFIGIKWLNFLPRIDLSAKLDKRTTHVRIYSIAAVIRLRLLRCYHRGQFSYLIPHTERRVNLCKREKSGAKGKRKKRKKRREEKETRWFDAFIAFLFRSSFDNIFNRCSVIPSSDFSFFSVSPERNNNFLRGMQEIIDRLSIEFFLQIYLRPCLQASFTNFNLLEFIVS